MGSRGSGSGEGKNGGRMPVAVRLAALPMLFEHGAWAHCALHVPVCEPGMVRTGHVRTACVPRLGAPPTPST